ncbi:MAG: hypothetical protein QOK17_2620 [Sphingomonadales bacterium]|jgi:hypothetical protein|nr:hypothetical protein [Sphingomonadales bacterium]
MHKSLVVLAFVAGCGASDQRNASAPAAAPAQPVSPSVSAPAALAPGSSLVGLYESGPRSRPNQLCVTQRGDTPQFGLLVWGAGMHGCSGAGTVERSGDGLALTMTGDSACRIEARIAGRAVTLPDKVPDGCAYYCGAGAHLEGVTLLQTGNSAADAAKAKDLAGDPLCG